MASAVDYLDHLSALAAVVDAFNAKDSRRNWRVIGCDVTAECHENEARLYSELSSHLIDAISWTQYVICSNFILALTYEVIYRLQINIR